MRQQVTLKRKRVYGKLLAGLLVITTIAGCAAGTPPLPYPAFIQVDELPNVFLAGLPGVRAKQLAGDPRTRRTSNRIAVPPDWRFTTGASPTQSVEIFVLAGSATLGEFELSPGSYAYLPPGTAGIPLASERGALLLYFVDDSINAAVIQTPIISNSELLDWDPTSTRGVWEKDLRHDPGSGARTWLARVDNTASTAWQTTSTVLEGYLLAGTADFSECPSTAAVRDTYRPGGYFLRPPGAVHRFDGTSDGAVWLLRQRERNSLNDEVSCPPAR